jgi:glycyl-tRNA synthetase beta subunit
VITAVLGEQAANPYRALIGVRQLTDWTKRAVWEPLLDGFARCVRITRSESERYPVDAALFQQREEHALYAAYQSAQARLTDTGDIDEFLNAFSAMIPAVTAYFGTGKGDGVLVNTDDAAVRRNRIGLLQAISAMQTGRADLSQLAGF